MPKVSASGLLRRRSSMSAAERTGESGRTLMPKYSSTISASGVKSAWPYGVSPAMCALSVMLSMMSSSTWPSPGLARSWFSAIVPLPPGRLTMTIGTSSSLCACMMRWISRAVRSPVPAAALATMKVTGLGRLPRVLREVPARSRTRVPATTSGASEQREPF